MSDNIVLKDGVAATFTMRTKEISAGLHVPTSTPFDTVGSPLFTSSNPGRMALADKIATASFIRPVDTTQYTAGDLVTNSTSLGTVVPLEFTVGISNGKTVRLLRARLSKTYTNVSAASFRLHLYRALPVPSNADNSAWLTNKAADYIGSVNFDAANARVFTDGAVLTSDSSAMLLDPASDSQKVYGLLEARDAYTPDTGESFAISLEVSPN